VVGSRRTLILIASLVIGALAAFALFSYVRGIEERAYERTEPVAVFVVRQPIPAGTEGTLARAQNLIVQQQIPREFRPPTALTDLSTIDGKVANLDLAPGQVVTSNMFVDTQLSSATLADRLGANEVAITVSLDQVRAVGGRLQPSDRVMMMVLVDAARAGDVADGTVTDGGQSVRFLYQDVEILAIGDAVQGEVSGSATPVQSSGLITFRVKPEAAQRIALAGSQIYLALAPKNWQLREIPPVDLQSLFDEGLSSSKAG
jgi:pilus assembly protein CpaB